jgi:hypothetical protein
MSVEKSMAKLTHERERGHRQNTDIDTNVDTGKNMDMDIDAVMDKFTDSDMEYVHDQVSVCGGVCICV